MDDLYAPPASQVADTPRPRTADAFFVVAPGKAVALYVATFGLYELYWWHRHWALYRRHAAAALWPVARTLFAFLFAHSLNRKIDHRLQGTGYRWAPGGLATLYVAGMVGSVAAEIAVGEAMRPVHGTLLSIAGLGPTAFYMWRTQRAANIACGDADASRNRELTWANWLWIVVGVAVWGLVLVGGHGLPAGLPMPR